jgi:hypothetical protein
MLGCCISEQSNCSMINVQCPLFNTLPSEVYPQSSVVYRLSSVVYNYALSIFTCNNPASRVSPGPKAMLSIF